MLFEEFHGQLFVSIKECRKVTHKGNGAFCLLQLDKQQVQTGGSNLINLKEEFAYEPWDEGFTFDITNTNATLLISVLGTNEILKRGQPVDNSEVMFIGQILIPVTSLIHQNPVDQWFKLSSNKLDSKDITGEIHLKLQYTKISKKVTPEDFEPLMVVGRGSFAKVMLVRKIDTNRLYAMKVIRKDSVIKHNAVKHTLSERNVLMRINNPFIVSLKYSFQTEDKLYMILDYIAGGELFYHLSDAEKFVEQRARFYAAEIVVALGYIHKLNIVYRDLKPENLLLDMNGHICLTDFGLCKEGLGFGNVTHTFCGSPEYLAPEIFLGSGYDKTVDWWALGTLLYEMLSGLPPYFSEDIDEMNERILTEPLTFPKYFSDEARSLLKGLLDRNPKKRLGSGPTGVEDIKKHPFFRLIDWNKLENKEIEPPFRPCLKSELDVRFFDPESTQQTARLSFLSGRDTLSSKEQDLFNGFSYVAPDERRFMDRRRSSSGSRHLPRRMSRSNSGASIPSSLYTGNSSSPGTKESNDNKHTNSLNFMEHLQIYDATENVTSD